MAKHTWPTCTDDAAEAGGRGRGPRKWMVEVWVTLKTLEHHHFVVQVRVARHPRTQPILALWLCSCAGVYLRGWSDPRVSEERATGRTTTSPRGSLDPTHLFDTKHGHLTYEQQEPLKTITGCESGSEALFGCRDWRLLLEVTVASRPRLAAVSQPAV